MDKLAAEFQAEWYAQFDWTCDDEERAEFIREKIEEEEAEAHVENRERTIASYAFKHNDDDFTIKEWFIRSAEDIAVILADENEEYEDPNMAAAQACIALSDELIESCANLAELLLKKAA